jgi:hypothetical protein
VTALRGALLALVLAAAPAHGAAAGDWTVLDRSGRRVETIEEGIGDRLIRRDATGRRLGTIEEGIGDRLIIRDRAGRREATVEPGIGDRLKVLDPAGRRVYTIEPGIGGRLVIKDRSGRRARWSADPAQRSHLRPGGVAPVLVLVRPILLEIFVFGELLELGELPEDAGRQAYNVDSGLVRLAWPQRCKPLQAGELLLTWHSAGLYDGRRRLQGASPECASTDQARLLIIHLSRLLGR